MSALMTDRQYSFLASLISTRPGSLLTIEQLDARRPTLTMKEASRFIDEARRLPETPREEVEAGLYMRGGTVYSVKLSQYGRTYAKTLDPDTGRYEYTPGAVRSLTAADRLTLEQAKEYGISHGHCAVCGRELTDEASVAAGIGPVCIKRFGR